MYRRKDVEYVMQIRKLLYEDGFTIAGAREKLREESRSNRSQHLDAQVLNAATNQDLRGGSQESQAQLPFLTPAHDVYSKEELRRVRQQICEVLDLLS
jgi:DNA-binding transcriptional MerR regulator